MTLPTRTRLAVLLLATVSIATTPPAGALAEQQRPAGTAFARPTRTTPPAAPEAPPAVPIAMLTLTPMAFELKSSGPLGDSSDRAPLLVTRTSDRVHVRLSATREWLYVRNPLDPRRVSATLVDHTQRVIISYEESDLRNALGIRGWLDVITLDVDLATLIRRDVDRLVLAAPDTRFPAYRVVEYTDWLEGFGAGRGGSM